MPYATLPQLQQSFGTNEITQLLSRYSDSAAVLQRMQNQADSEINARLASRYAVPLAVVPSHIVGLACDIIRYTLYDDAAPEQVVNRYRDALSFLDKVQSGRATLIGDDGLPLAQQTADITQQLSTIGVVAPVMEYGSCFEKVYYANRPSYR